MESWMYIALIAAVNSAILNISIKDLSNKIDEYAAGFIRHLVIIPALWILLIAFGIPKVEPIFWVYIAIMLPIEIVMVNLYQKAFRISPVSLLIPIQSLSPVFIAIVSFLVFKESLTVFHFAALVLFVSGIYVLNLNPKNKHIFAPIRSLFDHKGVFYMLLVAILLGVTVSMGKRAIVASSPQFFPAVYYLLVTFLLFPLYKLKSKVGFKEFAKHKRSILILAILNPINLMLIFSALKIGPTAIVQALYSTSVFFSVILAGTFLKETGIKKRLIASVLILAGSVLIIFK